MLFLLPWAPFAAGAQEQAALPCTYLYDTGKVWAAAGFDPAKLPPRSGWIQLEEDDTTHKFQGSVVLENDKLILVVHTTAPGVAVYARTAAGPRFRAVIGPEAQSRLGLRPDQADPVGTESQPTKTRILENNLGTVAVEVTCKSSSGPAAFVYRLTAGQSIVEASAGEGARQLQVANAGRFAVVPDFFGDDMVFDADASRPLAANPAGLLLPAENFFLVPAGQGDSLLMCVWPSGRQSVRAIVDASRREFSGFAVDCLKDKSVWLAVIEGQSLWHQQTIEGQTQVAVDWAVPFPAKWRVDLLGRESFAQSCFVAEDESASGVAVPADVAGAVCCFQNGRPLIRLEALRSLSAAEVLRHPTGILIYPLDRNRTTPLTTFCPIDVLRATLGVGPCQYILQTEGLAAEGDPTPDNVMTNVEKLFARKREQKSADEIREMLQQMVEHVGHAQSRIERYAAFGREVQTLVNDSSLPSCSDTLAYLQHAVATASSPSEPPARAAARLADAVVAQIGKPSGAAEVARIGRELRALGTRQDSTLAKSRMAVRWLRSLAIMASPNPPSTDAATKLRVRCDQLLGVK